MSNWDKCVENALRYIRSKPELVSFVRDFDENMGFMFSSDARLRDIDNALDSDGHSGASFACCLRECQRILRKETCINI